MNLATRMMISLVIVFLEILFLLGNFDGPYLFLGFWIGLPLAYVLRHVVHPRIHHRHLSRQFLAFLCCIIGAQGVWLAVNERRQAGGKTKG